MAMRGREGARSRQGAAERRAKSGNSYAHAFDGLGLLPSGRMSDGEAEIKSVSLSACKCMIHPRRPNLRARGHLSRNHR